VTGASLGVVVSFAARRRADLAICASLLLFDLYIGFCHNLALTIVALFVIALTRQKPRRLVLLMRARWWLATVGTAVLLFGYKFLYRPIKQGNWARVGDLLAEPTFLLDAVRRSEPFTTQAILNRVLSERFVAPLADLSQLFYQFIFFAPELGATGAVGFPGYRSLFPYAIGGIGNNVWA
jgi:hypothetical protein